MGTTYLTFRDKYGDEITITLFEDGDVTMEVDDVPILLTKHQVDELIRFLGGRH